MNELNLSHKRTKFKKRRNIIRRLFLISFVLFLVFLINCTYLTSIKNKPAIEIYKNNLIDTNYLIKLVSSEIEGKNFFTISSRKISNILKSNLPLLDSTVARKYAFPVYKILVSVNEKPLWAKMLLYNSNSIFSEHYMYISSFGDVIFDDHLNLNKLPENLLVIHAHETHVPQKDQLLLLKNAFSRIQKTGLFVTKLFLDKEFNLVIYTGDDILIRAGTLDKNLINKIKKLDDLMSIINKYSSRIQYLDLNLETSAILKMYSEDANNNAKRKDKGRSSRGFLKKVMLKDFGIY